MSSPKRYPSDLTDEQWRLVTRWLPAPKTGGRPVKWSRREIVNAIAYRVRTGCSWRQLPRDFPPWQTVYEYYREWAADGTTKRLHDYLRGRVRRAEGRGSKPSAGIVDSQSIRGADTVGRATRGYDAGKKVNGRKRHIVVDTIGMLLVVMVTAACVQDRDGARPLLERARREFPGLRLVWVDGGYAGRLVAWAASLLKIAVTVVAKPAGQRGFEVLPRRWVVERTFAWLTKCRLLARDYERLPVHAETDVHWAMIGLMTRRLAPEPGRRPWQKATA